MKKVILPFALIVAVQAFVVAANLPATGVFVNRFFAVFEWVSTTYDFGTIKKGIPVEHEFEFTNTGSEPLVISSVKASCGCTVTSYTATPIPAGEKGYVMAKYNAASPGIFTKSVTVNANTESGTVQLFIKGEVIE